MYMYNIIAEKYSLHHTISNGWLHDAWKASVVLCWDVKGKWHKHFYEIMHFYLSEGASKYHDVRRKKATSLEMLFDLQNHASKKFWDEIHA